MTKRKGKRLRVLFIHANGERKIVCNLVKFAREQNMSIDSAKSLSIGRELCIKGWYSPKHPKFKERYTLDNQKIINLKTKEIKSLNRKLQQCADEINSAASKLYSLKYGIRKTLKDWVLLDTYNRIYSVPSVDDQPEINK